MIENDNVSVSVGQKGTLGAVCSELQSDKCLNWKLTHLLTCDCAVRAAALPSGDSVIPSVIPFFLRLLPVAAVDDS